MKNDRLKLSLDDLKVQSFVTTLSEEQQQTLRGGFTLTRVCSSSVCSSGNDPCTDSVTECDSLITCDTTYVCSTGSYIGCTTDPITCTGNTDPLCY